VSSSAPFLNPSQAARRLGVSTKALRLYEQRGLVAPARTPAGWRAYGPSEVARLAEIAALRGLGLSLAEVARVLAGEVRALEPALAAHQLTLEARIRQLGGVVDKVRGLRTDLASGRALATAELIRLVDPPAAVVAEFDLPWPWGGERFEVRDVRSLNYIVGPLGSGKTRLALRLAEALPGGFFLGLERLADASAAARARLESDAALKSRVDQALAWLAEDGAAASDALTALLTGLESEDWSFLVIDVVEHSLNEATQEALIAHLRRHPCGRPLFLLTRSSAILDLAAVGPDEAILLCPANHSPPSRVAPYPGSPGYEAVATCLAAPDVRARTEGLIAWRPQVA
jgi:DNA-binding transcriptional MerR regulator